MSKEQKRLMENQIWALKEKINFQERMRSIESRIKEEQEKNRIIKNAFYWGVWCGFLAGASITSVMFVGFVV